MARAINIQAVLLLFAGVLTGCEPSATLEDLAVPAPWPAIEAAGETGYTLQPCENPRFWNAPVQIEEGGTLREVCVPDALYSWGDYKKLEWYKTHLGAEGGWEPELPRPLFMARSPLSTFGYGPVSIRMRFKQGTRYKVHLGGLLKKGEDLCKTRLLLEEYPDTVLVLPWERNYGGHRYAAVDYVLCSTGPVHSWSYGRKEHYEEMLKELRWIASHSDEEYDLWYKTPQGENLLLGDFGPDGMSFSGNTLRSNLVEHLGLAKRDAGEIFFNEGVAPGARDHFRAEHPIFFNEE